MMAEKTKVAILGGGFGSLAAAVGLTDPEVGDRYDVTVYQQGWRLGGKGASSRNPDACHRIEEHGLHAWGGYYENAFRVLERCYRELGGSWQEHFRPQSNITWPDLFAGEWTFAPTELDERPGDWPGEGGDPPPPATLVCKMLPRLRQRLEGAMELLRRDLPLDHLLGNTLFGRVLDDIAGDAQDLLLRLLDRVIDRIQAESDEMCSRALLDAGTAEMVADALELFRSVFRRVVDPDRDREAQRLFVHVDFGVTLVIGMVRDEVTTRGFDAIDAVELRAWLTRHGAHQATLDSRAVHSLYDYGFSYLDGDVKRPSLAASVALRVFFRFMCASRGAVQWKMRTGMGEAVFLPIYQALVKRGVKFRFFHRVTALRCEGEAISAIEIARQVRLEGDTYEPIEDDEKVGPYWPPEPRWSQIDDRQAGLVRTMRAETGHDLETSDLDGEAEPLTLRAGTDFDKVVLGISLGALRSICADLVREKRQWRELVDHLPTVRTQSFQAWLVPTMADLGWKSPPPEKEKPTFTVGYQDPFNTWADMTHLVPVEGWPREERPGALLYFCGPMAESDAAASPKAGHASARENARAWLDANAGAPWPGGASPANPAGLDVALLAAPPGTSPADRFAAQYFRANVAPSERYVLSPPGSARFRLPAGDSGFANLFLAGDWVATGLNFGCMEAAAMGGLQASRAICRNPPRVFGERDIQDEQKEK